MKIKKDKRKFKYYLIYKITNKINKMFYIGQHRTNKLKDGYKGSGKELKKAFKKFGIKNFTKEILFIFDNFEDMDRKEKKLITQKQINDPMCYNVNLGGVRGVTLGDWSGKKNGMFGVHRHGKKNPNFGNRRTKKWKKEHSKRMKKKFECKKYRKKRSENACLTYKIFRKNKKPKIVKNVKKWADKNGYCNSSIYGVCTERIKYHKDITKVKKLN